MNLNTLLQQTDTLCLSGKNQEALVLLDAARKKENHPALMVRIADIFLAIGMVDAARETLHQGLTAFPDSFEMIHAFANHAYITDCIPNGLKVTRMAIEKENCPTDVLLTHAHLCKAAGDVSAAEKIYKQFPNHYIAQSGLGGLYLDERRYADSIAQYEKALAHQPGNHAIAMHVANASFRSGDLKKGWHYYEARFGGEHKKGIVEKRFSGIPRWDGSAIQNGALLLWGEQGVGEEILYSTMLNDAFKQAGGKVICECDKRLVHLFQRSFPDINFIAKDTIENDAHYTAQSSTGQLGALFRSDFSTFSKESALLKTEVKNTADLRKRYDAKKNQLGKTGNIIGISWKSKKLRHGDPKSTDFSNWVRFFENSPHLFVCLQYGDIRHERTLAEEKNWPVLFDDTIDQNNSLDDFASQIAAMDKVITVSNTTAHMAGVLGIPTAVLLPTSRGLMWHWFDNKKTSPWYPSVILLRQDHDGQWDDVLSRAYDFINPPKTN